MAEEIIDVKCTYCGMYTTRFSLRLHLWRILGLTLLSQLFKHYCFRWIFSKLTCWLTTLQRPGYFNPKLDKILPFLANREPHHSRRQTETDFPYLFGSVRSAFDPHRHDGEYVRHYDAELRGRHKHTGRTPIQHPAWNAHSPVTERTWPERPLPQHDRTGNEAEAADSILGHWYHPGGTWTMAESSR